jgi:hypothetical protein
MLKGNEKKILKRIEGNCLKRLLTISTKCKSEDLYLTFDMPPTIERIKWLKSNHYFRMTNNKLTSHFLNEVEKLQIKDSLPNEIKKLTEYIVLPDDCNLKDKSQVDILDLNDSIEMKKTMSKRCEMLSLVFQMENADDMRMLANNLLEYDRTQFNYTY